MDNVFLELVEETLQQNGIDTTDMTDEEKIAKFQELADKDSEVAEEVVEKVANEAEEETDANAEPEPQAQESPAKLV